MGACCVPPQITDEEIDKCQTIQELISVMISKKEQLPLERKEILENINNPTFNCTYSDISVNFLIFLIGIGLKPS